jgi:hypothetical protein
LLFGQAAGFVRHYKYWVEGGVRKGCWVEKVHSLGGKVYREGGRECCVYVKERE